MHWLTSLFHTVIGILDSPKAQAVEKQLADLTQKALPIVQEVAALVPNKTVQEIAAAYQKFGVPLAAQISADPTSTGNALLNLSTALLQKSAPAATSLLNTAIQLAVIASKIQ